MEMEDEFDVTIPDDPPNLAYKSVFTRDPFRLSDLAEMVYLQQGSGHPPASGWWWGSTSRAPARHVVPFTQLSGSITTQQVGEGPLYDDLGNNPQGQRTYRRRTDGMVSVRIPAATVTIGSEAGNALADERPAHVARLSAFLIDSEPVSTTAYCRFLNSIGPVAPSILHQWFLLPPEDRRRQHELLRRSAEGEWEPLPGTERLPMVLVSWCGANAYALWANHHDWARHEEDGGSFLPSEAQWEYAARGATARAYPWGDEPPTPERMRYAQHRPGNTYQADTMPLAEVHVDLGLSPLGLRHMAGNVWQWCRDWYSPSFYHSPEACEPNPVNRQASHVRSERGGSWIGPAFLCRSSYRRGRVPSAKGRCLGFRCVGEP